MGGLQELSLTISMENFMELSHANLKKMCDDINLKIYSTHTPITIDNAPLYVERH